MALFMKAIDAIIWLMDMAGYFSQMEMFTKVSGIMTKQRERALTSIVVVLNT